MLGNVCTHTHTHSVFVCLQSVDETNRPWAASMSCCDRTDCGWASLQEVCVLLLVGCWSELFRSADESVRASRIDRWKGRPGSIKHFLPLTSSLFSQCFLVWLALTLQEIRFPGLSLVFGVIEFPDETSLSRPHIIWSDLNSVDFISERPSAEDKVLISKRWKRLTTLPRMPTEKCVIVECWFNKSSFYFAAPSELSPVTQHFNTGWNLTRM